MLKVKSNKRIRYKSVLINNSCIKALHFTIHFRSLRYTGLFDHYLHMLKLLWKWELQVVQIISVKLKVIKFIIISANTILKIKKKKMAEGQMSDRFQWKFFKKKNDIDLKIVIPPQQHMTAMNEKVDCFSS